MSQRRHQLNKSASCWCCRSEQRGDCEASAGTKEGTTAEGNGTEASGAAGSRRHETRRQETHRVLRRLRRVSQMCSLYELLECMVEKWLGACYMVCHWHLPLTLLGDVLLYDNNHRDIHSVARLSHRGNVHQLQVDVQIQLCVNTLNGTVNGVVMCSRSRANSLKTMFLVHTVIMPISMYHITCEITIFQYI